LTEQEIAKLRAEAANECDGGDCGAIPGVYCGPCNAFQALRKAKLPLKKPVPHGPDPVERLKERFKARAEAEEARQEAKAEFEALVHCKDSPCDHEDPKFLARILQAFLQRIGTDLTLGYWESPSAEDDQDAAQEMSDLCVRAWDVVQRHGLLKEE